MEAGWNSKFSIHHAAGFFRSIGVNARVQPSRYQSQFKVSFYLDVSCNHLSEAIRQFADENGVAVNITECVVGSNDPAGSLDVDFIPSSASKGTVSEYIKRLFKPERTVAFGDNFNDEKMFHKANTSYLVGNSSVAVKRYFESRENIVFLEENVLAGVNEGLLLELSI